MKATPFEFRFRIFIAAALYILGFWAPWPRYGAVAPSSTLWLAATTIFARWQWLPLDDAALLVTTLAILFALAGAALRVWGTAYLGSTVVHSPSMQAVQVRATGPYRYVRNPLYLGTCLFSAGVSILMPPTGALFFLLASAIFYFRLILAEEDYLTRQLGEPYEEYRLRVPRLLPKLRPLTAASEANPHWGQSLLAEIYSVGFSLCLAVLAWRYQPRLLIRCLLICFGLSLVSRALLSKEQRIGRL